MSEPKAPNGALGRNPLFLPPPFCAASESLFRVTVCAYAFSLSFAFCRARGQGPGIERSRARAPGKRQVIAGTHKATGTRRVSTPHRTVRLLPVKGGREGQKGACAGRRGMGETWRDGEMERMVGPTTTRAKEQKASGQSGKRAAWQAYETPHSSSPLRPPVRLCQHGEARHRPDAARFPNALTGEQDTTHNGHHSACCCGAKTWWDVRKDLAFLHP